MTAYREALLDAGQVIEWDGTGYDWEARGSGRLHVQAFPSVEDWNREKPGYEWLFPFIDKNEDGKISLEEHQAFQEYKQKNKNWATILKARKNGGG